MDVSWNNKLSGREHLNGIESSTITTTAVPKREETILIALLKSVCASRKINLRQDGRPLYLPFSLN